MQLTPWCEAAHIRCEEEVSTNMPFYAAVISYLMMARREDEWNMSFWIKQLNLFLILCYLDLIII